MFKTFIWIIIILIATFGHSFLSALSPPLNLIEILHITLLLSFFLGEFDQTLILSLFLGFARDYIENNFIGISIPLYLVAGIIIYTLQNTIFTHQKKISIFLLILIFNTSYSLMLTLITFRFNLIILQESLLSIVINSLIAFLILMLIKKIKLQLNKKFI